MALTSIPDYRESVLKNGLSNKVPEEYSFISIDKYTIKDKSDIVFKCFEHDLGFNIELTPHGSPSNEVYAIIDVKDDLVDLRNKTRLVEFVFSLLVRACHQTVNIDFNNGTVEFITDEGKTDLKFNFRYEIKKASYEVLYEKDEFIKDIDNLKDNSDKKRIEVIAYNSNDAKTPSKVFSFRDGAKLLNFIETEIKTNRHVKSDVRCIYDKDDHDIWFEYKDKVLVRESVIYEVRARDIGD